QFDRGLAWAAHELRGPLLEVRLAIEHALRLPDREGDSQAIGKVTNHRLLSRSLFELETLAGQIDALLLWGSGKNPLRRRATRLAEVVREAVSSAVWSESERARVIISGDLDIVLLLDRFLVQRAISNIVRNALAYSAAETEIQIVLQGDDNAGSVAVVS